MAGDKDKNVFNFLKNKSNRRDRNTQVDRSHKENDSSSEPGQESKDCKQRRSTPERRESGRLQSAARILRSLGRGGDDSNKQRSKENGSSGMDRKNPQYHSEGKGLRKKPPPLESSSKISKERSHSFCDKETQRRISRDAFTCESPILELPSASNSPKTERSREITFHPKLSDIDSYENSQVSSNIENIYEQVSNPNEEAVDNVNSLEATSGSMVAPTVFDREKERRSVRKLTKDSGYETSPYSESDYANMELRGEEVPSASLADDFRVNSSVSVIQTCVPPEAHPKEKAETTSHCYLSTEARARVGNLKESSHPRTAPAPYPENSFSDLSRSRNRSPLPKFPSVDSLGHFAESSEPSFGSINSLLPARSTPSLCQLAIPNKVPCQEETNGHKLLSSKSTPNLEERKNERMVTNRSLMNPFGHKRDKSPTHKSREMYYDVDLSRKESVGQRDYANHLRSSSYQILHSRQSSNGYHSRQHSSGSGYSDDTITDDILPSQSHTLPIGIPDQNGRCPINSDANYFVQWDQPDQELGYVPQMEPQFYSSSQLNFSPAGHQISSDHSLSNDKFMSNSSKLHPSPPPPPVRDASSLKYVRYGPGHEKFPSWPVPAGAASQVLSTQHIHDATLSTIPDPSLLGLPQGCHRSHSWTEQSEFPKSNSGAYTRPYMRNQFNPNFQSQLITVMESCEKIPPEMFHSKHPEELFHNHGDVPIEANQSESLVYCPPYDREGRPIDDKDYNIPSPPQRDPGMGDVNLCHFTSAQLEEHAHLYGLTNYEEFRYITPFLDQLRQESYVWDEHSERDSGRGESESVADSSRYSNGRESVTTVVTNSSSASSSETLKWHGSFSDISVISGNSRDAKRDPNVAHSSRVKAPQRQNSESVMYYETDVRGRPRLPDSKSIRDNYNNYRDTESGYVRSSRDSKWMMRDLESGDCNSNLKKFPSYSYSQPLSQINESPAAESIEGSNLSYTCPQMSSIEANNVSYTCPITSTVGVKKLSYTTANSPTVDVSKPPSVADGIIELEKQSRSAVNPDEIRSPANVSELKPRLQVYSADSRKPSFSSKSNPNLLQNGSAEQIVTNSKPDQESVHSRAIKMPTRSLSMSRRDVEDFAACSDKYSISSAERRLANSAYTYLDPNKQCMVSDSTLKNIQKQALLSFYERKTGKGSNNNSYQDSPNSSISQATNSNNGRIGAPSLRSEGQSRTRENLARIGQVPADIEVSPKLQYKNSFNKCHANNIDDPAANTTIDHSSCLQNTLPEIHPSQLMTGLSPGRKSPVLSSCDGQNNSCFDNDLEDESRDVYPISHSPSSSNLQLKCENVTAAPPGNDTSPKPPDRPPKKPNLRANYTTKPKILHETDSLAADYKNVQRKPYYYKKPPAPDPPASPPEERPKSQLLNTVKNQLVRACTPDLPPPPPPPNEEDPVIASDEPLPPPPSETAFEDFIQETICEDDHTPQEQKAYHKDSYMAHRRDWTTGFEGRYRRTHSPSAPSQRNLQLTRPRAHESSMNIRNLQRSGISAKALSTSNGEPIPMRSSVSTSNLSPVGGPHRDSDATNNNNLCQTSRNLAQSADWSSHNTSITVNFSSEELKAFKAKKANMQLSAFRKYNSKDSRQHHPREVGGSVQSLASSSEASQSSTPSDESRFSSSWKTSLDSLNRPPSGMSEFSCNLRPISRAISVGEPLHRLESQELTSRPTNIVEPLQIITLPNDEYSDSCNKSNSSPVHLNRLSNNGESMVSHDGPVTAHPATVTEDSLPSSPVSIRDQMNATSTPKSSPDNSPKSSLQRTNSPNPIVSHFQSPSGASQSSTRHLKDSSMQSLCSNLSTLSIANVSPNNCALSTSALQCDRTPELATSSATSPSQLRLFSPTGTSCSMAPLVPDDQLADRSNIISLGYGRKASKEEIEYEKQSEEFVSGCICDPQLKTLLAPGKNHKTIASYMQNLFSLELRKDLLCSHHLKHPDLRSTGNLLSIGLRNGNSRTSGAADSAYLTVSDCRARLFAKVQSSSSQSPVELRSATAKKENLLKCLTSKVNILKEEQLDVKSEICANSDLGLRVTDMISTRAKTSELSRYKLHVEEIDKIISLLLVLCGRLAKAENSLSQLSDSSTIEKKTLENKRDKLKEQLDEAKKLKESIDKRAIQVSKFLMQYLNETEFAEYDHYVKMKAKLFMDSREIDEKVKLAEEQLQALRAASL